jgi:hypothetical protein
MFERVVFEVLVDRQFFLLLVHQLSLWQMP